MIQPTVGRVVLFRPFQEPGEPIPEQPCAALVAYVHDERLINIGYFGHDGLAKTAVKVPLLQDDDAAPENGYYAEWMPCQKGQAAKYEALEAASKPAATDSAATAEGNQSAAPAVDTEQPKPEVSAFGDEAPNQSADHPQD